jgi:hypothetical protein
LNLARRLIPFWGMDKLKGEAGEAQEVGKEELSSKYL